MRPSLILCSSALAMMFMCFSVTAASPWSLKISWRSCRGTGNTTSQNCDAVLPFSLIMTPNHDCYGGIVIAGPFFLMQDMYEAFPNFDSVESKSINMFRAAVEAFFGVGDFQRRKIKEHMRKFKEQVNTWFRKLVSFLSFEFELFQFQQTNHPHLLLHCVSRPLHTYHFNYKAFADSVERHQ